MQSYRTPIYYVDLTLRNGVNLNDAITSAKQIDDQSKQTHHNHNNFIGQFDLS